MLERSAGLVTVLLVLPIVMARYVDSLGSGKNSGPFLFKERSLKKDSLSESKFPRLHMREKPPKTLLLREMDSKVIECQAGGNPPPFIHWLKNGFPTSEVTWDVSEGSDIKGEDEILSNEGQPEKTLGLSFTKSRLYLDCVSSQDAGEYTCVAENPYQRISSSTQVTTVAPSRSTSGCMDKKDFGKPARIRMWTETRLEFIGTDVRLFCRAEGLPAPTVEWLGPRDEPLDDPSKYEVLKDGDLIIRKLTFMDMGGYKCLADNSHGSDSTDTFLYPTRPGK